MPAQNGFDEEVDAVAHNGERDSLFSAAPVEREKTLVDGQICGKGNERVAICLDELNLTGETFLTRDVAFDPSGLPFLPGREGKGFQYGIGSVEGGDRAVEIAVDFRRYDSQMAWRVDVGGQAGRCAGVDRWLAMNHGNPFVTDPLG